MIKTLHCITFVVTLELSQLVLCTLFSRLLMFACSSVASYRNIYIYAGIKMEMKYWKLEE